MVLSKFLEDVKKIFNREEPDPWGYVPPEPVSQEEIEEAVEQWIKPKPAPVWGVNMLIMFSVLWILSHLLVLYISYGTTFSAGIFVLVFFNLVFNGHYLYLLLKERKNRLVKQ